jgi:hypothetical protein
MVMCRLNDKTTLNERQGGTKKSTGTGRTGCANKRGGPAGRGWGLEGPGPESLGELKSGTSDDDRLHDERDDTRLTTVANED